MIRSPWLRVYCMQLFALIRLGFPSALELRFLGLAAYLNSQFYSTKDTLQALPPVTSCRFMVSGSISLPLPGFFSPFPHGTSALSVAVQYLALDRGRPGFRQGFSCPALLRYRIIKSQSFRLQDCHFLRSHFPVRSAMIEFSLFTGHPHAALQPRLKRFGLFPVRSPLLRESLLISVPGLLRWFTSSSVTPVPYFIQVSSGNGISSIGLPHSAICAFNGYVLLNAAFRSLSRPSSPYSSQASTINLYFA